MSSGVVHLPLRISQDTTTNLSGTAGTLPATTGFQVGDIIVATDLGQMFICILNNASPQALVWQPLATPTVVRANGAADLTAANCVLAAAHSLDTNAAGRAVTLPTRAVYDATARVNAPLYFLSTNGGANAITVNAGAGNTINGAASVASSAVIANGPAVVIMPDPNSATNWLVLERS